MILQNLGHVNFDSPFVEVTFYNNLFTRAKVLLDVVKVLYRDQIYRTV